MHLSNKTWETNDGVAVSFTVITKGRPLSIHSNNRIVLSCMKFKMVKGGSVVSFQFVEHESNFCHVLYNEKKEKQHRNVSLNMVLMFSHQQLSATNSTMCSTLAEGVQFGVTTVNMGSPNTCVIVTNGE